MARFELFSGPERRRRWSEDQKRAVVAAAFAPGAIVAEVARRAPRSRRLAFMRPRLAARSTRRWALRRLGTAEARQPLRDRDSPHWNSQGTRSCVSSLVVLSRRGGAGARAFRADPDTTGSLRPRRGCSPLSSRRARSAVVAGDGAERTASTTELPTTRAHLRLRVRASNRLAVLTVSPMTANERLLSLPTSPTTAGP